MGTNNNFNKGRDGERLIVIITAPSGAGKTTIAKALLKQYPELALSVSVTTRAPRDGEVNGVDYYFIPVAEFEKKIATGDFVEYEMVYNGKYYGTLKSELGRIWTMGRIPLRVVDVVGALSIQEKYPKDSLSIFIMPPSLESLRERLSGRGTETPQSLEERVQRAAYELNFADRFEKVIINDVLEEAIEAVNETVGDFLKIKNGTNT